MASQSAGVVSVNKRPPEGSLCICDRLAAAGTSGSPDGNYAWARRAARRQEHYPRFRATIPFAISKSRITHVKKTGGPIGIVKSATSQKNF
jgi:hypothetical protein